MVPATTRRVRRGRMSNSRAASSYSPPPVRPLPERARDSAIFAGGIGGFAGACVSTLRHSSAFMGMALGATSSAAFAVGFVSLRHLIVGGDFRQDQEIVSGMALGTLGMGIRTMAAGRQAGAFAGATWFAAGCTLHYAHRYWLNWRLAKGYY